MPRAIVVLARFHSMKTVLITRIVTASILMGLLLFSIFYLPLSLLTVMAVIIVGLAAWEMATLLWNKAILNHLILLGSLLILFFLTQKFTALPILILGCIWWLVTPYFLWHYSKTGKNYFSLGSWKWIVGVLVFAPCLVGLVELLKLFGPAYLLLGLVIVWGADTGAYFTGMLFGKHKLAPQLSPKKTIEGLIGGILISFFVAIIGGLLLKVTGIKWLFLLTSVLVVCLWSVIGDLFESMLKRQAGVKDSGNLLPGHGGVYDRIDSLTAAIPIYTICLMIIY